MSSLAAHRLLYIGTLLLAVAGWTAPGSAQELPPAEQIIARHIEVTGGRAAHERIHNRKTVGTFRQGATGEESEIVVHDREPNHRHVRLLGRVWVVNSEASWTYEGGLLVVSGGRQERQAMTRASFNPHLHWKDVFVSADTVGIVELEGGPAYKVRMRNEHCEDAFEYFDVKSGLHVRTDEEVYHAGRIIVTENVYSDYREFDGVLLPAKSYRLLLSQGGRNEQFFEVTSVEHNIDMPEELFATPAELRTDPVRELDAAANDLPTAEVLFERYIEATGGRDAHEKLRSRRARGVVRNQDNDAVYGILVEQSAPNKQRVQFDLSADNSQIWASNGTHAWNDVGGAITPAEGDELQQRLLRAAFSPYLDWERLYASAETVDIDSVNGRPVYKVRLTTDWCETIDVYFDQERGLVSRTDVNVLYGGATYPARIVYLEYGEFDGVQYPTKYRRVLYTGGRPQVLLFEFDSVEHNVDLDPSLFATPAELLESS